MSERRRFAMMDHVTDVWVPPYQVVLKIPEHRELTTRTLEFLMDLKRKSVFDPPSDDDGRKTKSRTASKAPLQEADQSSLACRIGREAQKAPSDGERSLNQDRRSRLCLLKTLTQELVKSVDLIRDHAGDDITNAIIELDKAFRRAKTAVSPISRPDNNSVEFTRAQGNRNSFGIPELPPILDSSLELAVFTHPGLSKDSKSTYDRLEILGDAYIELIATRLIWSRFEDLSSGQISQIRELLVKNETLSEFATLYGLDSRASIPQDLLNQPRRWTKTKGDIFEAYVAAVILSRPTHGYDVAEQWLTQLWLPRLTDTAIRRTALDAKETLAKKIMGKGVKLKYVDERSPVQLRGGMQTFYVGVYLTGWGWQNKHLGSGHGPSKAVAGDAAARQALLNEPLINSISQVKKTHELTKI
ncbi:double-strand-specific pac1 ribonuclease [Aspergillus udagawae]|nr:double-strand-specific pac1 ribonuclease [Aspergillus udagawae]